MNMKKIFVIGLAVVFAVIAVVALGGAEKKEEVVVDIEATVQETQRVEGLIVSLGEGYFVMQDKDLGEIQVNYDASSVFEGVDASALAFGQYVFVDFDGKMTRSLPPQIFGLKVGMYPVSGPITAIAEGSVTIEQDNGAGDAIIHLMDGAIELSVGDAIIAYTNGAMTMSLPPQTTALAVEVTAAAE